MLHHCGHHRANYKSYRILWFMACAIIIHKNGDVISNRDETILQYIDMLHYSLLQYNAIWLKKILLPYAKVYNKRREGEYLTLTITIPCTNVLRKVPSINHRVLSFCISTLRETKGVLIGVNSVVLGIVDTR